MRISQMTSVLPETLMTPCIRSYQQALTVKHNTFQHGSINELQPFNGLFSRTTWVSRYQKGKTNLDFTEARDSEWQWHQLGHMQVCTSLQTDNHASTPPLCFLQAECPSCRLTNSVKALEAIGSINEMKHNQLVAFNQENVEGLKLCLWRRNEHGKMALSN